MSINRPTLLIRADAGPAIGTRHAIRSLSLARAWTNSKGTAVFACGSLPRGLLKKIASQQIHFIPLNHSECDQADAAETYRIAATLHPDWIILDGNRFPENYLAFLKQGQAKLLLIDDLGTACSPLADIALSQTISQVTAQSSHQLRSPISLGGPEYALLDEFISNRESSLPIPKKIATEAKKILVSLGERDEENWTLKTLQSISDLERKRIVVDCVIGSKYRHTAELSQFKKRANLNLRLHRNPDRLPQLLSRIDLAITSSDATFQLAYWGVPAIIINPLASESHAKVFTNNPAFQFNRHTTPSSRQELKHTIKQLIANAGQRKSMSELGQRQVDGDGAKRVVRAMKTGNLKLRTAAFEDYKIIWNWHNDPEVKSVALAIPNRSMDEFGFEFQTAVASRNTNFWMVENVAGNPIGYARFDDIDGERPPKISIIVDHSQRGRGVGTALISQASEKFFRETNHSSIVAQIRSGNIASEKAFRTAGFSGIQPVIVNGKMAIQFELKRPSGIPLPLPAERQRRSA
jgi:UDP-2,4-diacetamido-2,4,6-trideoxy-beta-L-altropyranose hydrolase